MDLIEIAKADVIEKAKAWKRDIQTRGVVFDGIDQDLYDAVVLLESRQAMESTSHLDNVAVSFEARER